MQSRPAPPITLTSLAVKYPSQPGNVLLSSDRILNRLSNLPEAQCDQDCSIDGCNLSNTQKRRPNDAHSASLASSSHN